MALTATFKADFSSFVEECKKAAAALDTVDKEAKETNTSLAGIKPPPGLDEVAKRSKDTGEKANTLKGAFQGVNDMLKVTGINIGNQIGALDELAGAIGKGSAAMGLFGTATTALAVGIGAFKLTSWILEW